MTARRSSTPKGTRNRGYELVARGIEALLGRRATVRYARFLLDEARLDGRQDMTRNGELLVQRGVLSHTGPRPAVVFDVGAHHGVWTQMLGRTAATAGRRVEAHLFEPTRWSFAKIERTLGSWPGMEVTLNRLGMSSEPGSATIYKPSDGAGSSSLHRPELADAATAESISLTTVDAYCHDRGIGRVDLLKCDAEGHDLAVFEGAQALLTNGRVAALQFEYNTTWIYARRFLRDAFEFFGKLGYEVGKVTPRGIEYYQAWDPELETFRNANLLAVAPVARHWFPTVAWWKG